VRSAGELLAERAPAPCLPRAFQVVDVVRHTPDTVTLTLRATDGGVLAAAPGQFTMLGRLGVGEVPISVSGDPAHPELLEHTVRDVGGVTAVLCRAQVDEVLTVRGPFGAGWRVDAAAGRDVVVAAGGLGLAPLRPVLLEVSAHPERYGRVTLLYGARTPADLLFRGDLERWRADHDVVVTVDAADPGWRGRVGLLPALVPAAVADPTMTVAFVCGPELMMRFTCAALLAAGVAAEHVEVSLERTMSCGVGLCGHCQLRELFVCVDGPVLSLNRVAALMALQEL
jgi:NAD(P)H-flavin reductase